MKKWLACLLTISIFASACAHYPVNQPVTDLGPPEGYAPRLNLAGGERSDDLVLLLAFSGGGTRAASLAYGVLKELQKTPVPGTENSEAPKTLLDEVDTISGVSGGSFTASYFGLKGPAGLDEFRDNFLYRRVQSNLTWRLLNPVNWWRLGSTKFGRSELAAEYYDKLLFHGATFGDIFDNPKTPNVSVVATDINNGNFFAFTKPVFAIICTDYKTFPVSRAVAASAAFPGAFGAVTLKNYSDRCRGTLAEEIEQLRRTNTNTRSQQAIEDISRYLDVKTTPFIHLQDGGIADNLGVRTHLNFARYNIDKLKKGEFGPARIPKRAVIIVVNAETSSQGYFSHVDLTPNMMSLLWEVFSIFIKNFNNETLEFLRSSFDEWGKMAVKDSEGKTRRMDLHIVEVNFRNLADKKAQKHFLSISTSLGLRKSDVDDLIAVGGELLRDSPEFQRFLTELAADKPRK